MSNPEPELPDLEPDSSRSVLVVGAGPVGMTAALALRAQGRAVMILEAGEEGRDRPGSRAIFVHKASLRLLEQIHPGLGWELAAHGLVWPTKRTFWRGREVFVRQYPPVQPGVLPPFSSLPQVEIERYLYQACLAAGVRIVWNAVVDTVETTATRVKVSVTSGQSWMVDYLIGADGARSGVRHSLGIEMEGSRSTNSYIVVDVAEDPERPLAKERIFHYEHPAIGRRNVLLVPFVGGWRIDLQCKDNDDLDALGGREGVGRWLAAVMPSRYARRITWVSAYQFLQVVARHFIDEQRRVLLIGEAAHLFAPFGARGMNSGIADAVTAAVAIDHALDATTLIQARTMIEEFAQARQAAAEYNRFAAGQALKHIQTHTLLMQAKRNLAALVAPYWKRAGAWLDEGPYGPRSGPPGQKAGSKY
jgi:3-(3-hydroxy-phenyl)propionate hydroxylase